MCLNNKNKTKQRMIIYFIFCIFLLTQVGCNAEYHNYLLQNYSVDENDVSWFGVTLGKTTFQEAEEAIYTVSPQRINSISTDEIHETFYGTRRNICFAITPEFPSIIARNVNCVYFSEIENTLIATNVNFFNIKFTEEEIFENIGEPDSIAIYRYRWSLDERRIIIISREFGYVLIGLEKAKNIDDEEFFLIDGIQYHLYLFNPDDFDSFISYFLYNILSLDQIDLDLFQDWEGFGNYSVTGLSS